MSKRKVGKPIGSRKVKEVPLFSVFGVESQKQVYPGKGVPEKEAQRLADNLLQDAYIKKVYDPEGE